jgi:hypothetical protein
MLFPYAARPRTRAANVAIFRIFNIASSFLANSKPFYPETPFLVISDIGGEPHGRSCCLALQPPSIAPRTVFLQSLERALELAFNTTQINAIATDVPAGTVPVTVTDSNGTSQSVMAQVSTVQPAFFQWGTDAVATRQDFSLAVKSGTFAGVTTVAAKPGDVMILWVKVPQFSDRSRRNETRPDHPVPKQMGQPARVVRVRLMSSDSFDLLRIGQNDVNSARFRWLELDFKITRSDLEDLSQSIEIWIGLKERCRCRYFYL